ncbi:MAG: radical SAM protein [Planctomycetaceae bacterium]|nr:radical SAM protein [Planctomycetaceae bacterium]
MNEPKLLKIARFSTSCSVLGPGKRAVVWVQGCARRCPGCVAPETWDPEGGTVFSVETLAEKLTRLPEIEGLTFSGGEPFLQAAGLCALADACRKIRPELTVMAFTGWTLEELLAREKREELALLARLDILIDGPYRETEHENLLWRGSRNQKVWFLTPRYERDWKPRIHETGVHLELEADSETLHIMGIPPKDFRAKIDEIARKLHLTQQNG